MDETKFSILTRMCDQLSKVHLHEIMITFRTNLALRLYLGVCDEVKRETARDRKYAATAKALDQIAKWYARKLELVKA